MGSIERRERERDDKRRQILNAARELFVTEGYEAVTMRKVADKVEYTPTAIYLHFKDKQELVREVVTQDFFAFAHHFASIAATPDPVEGLRAMGKRYLEFALKFPNHYRLMFMTQLPRIHEEQPAHKGNPSLDAYALLCKMVGDAIAQGRFRAEVTDVEFAAQLVWAGMHGIAALHTSCPKTDSWMKFRPVAALGRAMTDALINHMIRPDHAPPHPAAPRGKAPQRHKRRS